MTLLNGGSATYTANTTLAGNAVGNLSQHGDCGDGGRDNRPEHRQQQRDRQRQHYSGAANSDACSTTSIGQNANTLGSNWNQQPVPAGAALRVNNNQAHNNTAGYRQALWTAAFGSIKEQRSRT